jgi:hypothetical protein
MKKIIFGAVLLATSATMGAGCDSAWWQAFESNPILQVQTFEQGVQVVMNEAQLAWAVALPLIPTTSVAVVTQQYQNAVFAVNHALQVLNDAVTAAVAAKQPTPNFAALMTAITDAITQVLAIVNQYNTNQPIDAGTILATASGGAGSAVKGNPALADAYAGLANLKKMAGH